MGRAWYETGKYLHKKNTFTDFIDAARYLIDEGYTSPRKLVINGRSAGGLLMGAVTNLRPDHFPVPCMDLTQLPEGSLWKRCLDDQPHHIGDLTIQAGQIQALKVALMNLKSGLQWIHRIGSILIGGYPVLL